MISALSCGRLSSRPICLSSPSRHSRRWMPAFRASRSFAQSSVHIPANGKNKQGAREFLAYFYKPENLATYLEPGGTCRRAAICRRCRSAGQCGGESLEAGRRERRNTTATAIPIWPVLVSSFQEFMHVSTADRRSCSASRAPASVFTRFSSPPDAFRAELRFAPHFLLRFWTMLMLWRRQRWWFTPTLLIAPAIILFFTVILLSAVRSLWISLHDWDGMGLMTWTGFGNYLSSTTIRSSIRR